MSAPARRRPAARRRRTALPNAAWVAGAAATLVGVIWLGQWLLHHDVVAAVVEVGLGIIGVFVIRRPLQLARRWLRQSHDNGHTMRDFLAMDATQFEHALADLMRRDGCTSVRVVGGAGDLAADVIAMTPARRRYLVLRQGQQRIVVQAKRYAPGNPVRSPEVQKVGGTYRIVHGGHRAAVVTTSHFTRDAVGYGRQAGIRLLDAKALAAWADKTGPAPWH